MGELMYSIFTLTIVGSAVHELDPDATESSTEEKLLHISDIVHIALYYKSKKYFYILVHYDAFNSLFYHPSPKTQTTLIAIHE